MHPAPTVCAAFSLASAWGVGLAFSVALSDVENGWIRDHPRYGQRLSSRIAPLIIGLGGGSILAGAVIRDPGHPPPLWVIEAALVLLPFAIVARRWSRTWVGRRPAEERRKWGWLSVGAGILGLIAAWMLALPFLNPGWSSIIPPAVLASTGAMLGGLTNRMVMALTAHVPEQIDSAPPPVLAELAIGGLVLSVLPLIQVAGARGTPQASALVAVWAGGLAAAAVGLVLGLRARGRAEQVIWPATLAAAVAGQFAALLLVFMFPGLVPPSD